MGIAGAATLPFAANDVISGMFSGKGLASPRGCGVGGGWRDAPSLRSATTLLNYSCLRGRRSRRAESTIVKQRR